MEKDLVKYLNGLTKVKMGEFMSTLKYEYDIPLDYGMSIFNAIVANKKLTIAILKDDTKSKQTKSIYLQLLASTKASAMALLDLKFSTALNIPSAYNGDMIKFINMRDNILSLGISDLSIPKINDAIVRWGKDAKDILEKYHEMNVLNNDKFLRCTLAQALKITRAKNIRYDKDILDMIDFNVRDDFCTFEDSIDRARAMSSICQYVTDDKEKEKIIAKYGRNIKVLKNLYEVMRIERSRAYRGDKRKAEELAFLFKKKFITIIVEYTMGNIDELIQYLIKDCMTKVSPIECAKGYGTIVEDIAEGYPFLPDTILNLRNIATEVYDAVVDICSDEKFKRDEEKRKNKKRATNEFNKKMLPEAISMIEAYIRTYMEDRPISVSKYCDDNDIPRNTFDKNVKIISYLEPDLYTIYRELTKKNSVRALKVMNKALFAVIEALKDNPNLSIYNYYLITRFEPKILYRLSYSGIMGKRLTEEEHELFKEFYKTKSRYSKELGKGFFYSETFIIKGKTLTYDDKSSIMDYIYRKRFPLCIPVFREIARQYVDGSLQNTQTQNK